MLFYDEPELIHEINSFTLEIYETYLPKVLSVIQPDLIYIQEDLSGKNGPMISPDCFREFVGNYYRKLIPLLKKHGCGNVFVDTDGDFMKLIPEFIDAGVGRISSYGCERGHGLIAAVRGSFPNLEVRWDGFN